MDARALMDTLDRPREELEKYLLEGMAQFATVKQYEDFKAALATLTDEQFREAFLALAVESLKGYDDKKETPDHRIEQTLKIREMNGVQDGDSARTLLKVTMSTLDEAKAMRAVIQKSKVTDKIKLTGKQDIELQKIWMTPKEIESTYKILPSDIFFAKTIPLMDIEIEVDESDLFDAGPDPDRLCNYRVTILPNYASIIDRLELNESETVGYITVDALKGVVSGLYVPIIVTKGSNYLCGGPVGLLANEQGIEIFNQIFNMDNFSNLMYQLISTWYSIQIALLHPTVCEVFKQPKMVATHKKQHPGSRKKGGKKRPIKYTKVHTFDTLKYEKALYGEKKEKGKHNMTKLAWYVIGHWRQYKDGKRIFIQPYWKGPLRHLKQNCDNIESRDRIIYETAAEKEAISENIQKDREKKNRRRGK